MSVVSRGNNAINERYRPMRFSELIGNDKNKAGLTAWMNKGEKRSKSILLSGVSSGGKTTTARILAMGLNCEKGDTVEPCLECDACKAAMNGNAFHILEHNMSEANTKDAVDAIIQSMYETCITGRNKVYILDEVQKLTNSSQNLLLKTVEKPPQGVYLIFCTTEPDALIPTLRNRMEKYSYTLPTDQDIASILGTVCKEENISMTKEQKIEFFNFVKGMSYREILFNLEQFMSGADLTKIADAQKVDLFSLAKEIIYKGNFGAYQTVINSGANIEVESLRQMLRTMASKEIEKNGFQNAEKAAMYYDIFQEIDAKKFYDQNPRPAASALIWKICAEIRGM